MQKEPQGGLTNVFRAETSCQKEKLRLYNDFEDLSSLLDDSIVY
jgi:hypothetical protein